MRRAVLAAVVAGLAASVCAPASPAAEGELVAKIKRNVTIVDGGRTAVIELKARCPEGRRPSRRSPTSCRTTRRASSASSALPCDGKVHELTARSTALAFTFHEGRGRVSAYLLLTSGESILPTRLVRVSS